MKQKNYFKKRIVLDAKRIRELEEKNMTVRELNHLMFGKKGKK
jgi:hypothetical protein